MTKILISWKGINARISADPKEAIKQISSLTQMAQEDLKSGKLKDWGVFAGGSAGYAIFEGNEIDLAMEMGKYNPYFDIETHMVLSARSKFLLKKDLLEM